MRTVVLGLGNVLMGDDALGPFVVRTLEARYEMDPGVTLQDAGTPGLDLTPHLHGADALIVVDTVRSAGVPGELRRYRREQVMAGPVLPRVNPHQLGLKETLFLLDLAGASPREVLLVGVVPDRVEMGTELSEPVRAAVPAVLDAVVEELRRLGHAPSPRPAPAAPDIWWESARA